MLKLKENALPRFGEILIGIFFIYYTALMVPMAPVLYSAQGVVPVIVSESLVARWLFPKWMDTPSFAITIHLVTIAAACFLVAGKRVPIAAAVILLCNWYLYNRNSFTFAPDTGFMQAALLILTFRNYLGGKQIIVLAWLALGVGYTYSGLSKLDGDLWTSGRALRYFLINSDSLRLWVPAPPDIFRRPLMVITYTVLFLEIAALALVAIRPGRIAVWGVFLAFHLVNIFIFDFVQLSIGCALVHLLILQWSLTYSKDFDGIIGLAQKKLQRN